MALHSVVHAQTTFLDLISFHLISLFHLASFINKASIPKITHGNSSYKSIGLQTMDLGAKGFKPGVLRYTGKGFI